MNEFKKDSSQREQNRHKPGWYALFALIAFVAIDHLGDLLHQLDLRRFFLQDEKKRSIEKRGDFTVEMGPVVA